MVRLKKFPRPVVCTFPFLRIWAFPSALTAHGTFVRVNFGVISVWARRWAPCREEDLHALRRDVIRSRQCTGCIVPLRGVRMEGFGPSLSNSRGRSRSGFGSSRVQGLRRGHLHRDSFSPSRLFLPCSVLPCVGGTYFFRLPYRIGANAEGSAVVAHCCASRWPACLLPLELR